jgi:hypothetical protein
MHASSNAKRKFEDHKITTLSVGKKCSDASQFWKIFVIFVIIVIANEIAVGESSIIFISIHICKTAITINHIGIK